MAAFFQFWPSWIQPFCTKLWLKVIQPNSYSFIPDSTWWWQPSWILPSLIQPFCTKLWLKLIQSNSNSFILIQLDDGSHLEFYHLGFSILHKKIFTHSFWLNLMMAAILNSDMLNSETAILDSKDTFTYSFSLNLMMVAILKTAILDSTTLHKTLNQTNSIWLKLIHSGLNLMMAAIFNSGHLWFKHLSFTSHTHSNLPRMVATICTKKTHSHFPPHHLHKNLHSFILAQFDDGSHLEFWHVEFRTAILGSDTLLSSLRFT